MYVAKSDVLISYAVPVQLICAFVFAYAKSRFSRDAAHLMSLSVIHKIYIVGAHIRFALLRPFKTNQHPQH